jgi:hypothetical protein
VDAAFLLREQRVVGSGEHLLPPQAVVGDEHDVLGAVRARKRERGEERSGARSWRAWR